MNIITVMEIDFVYILIVLFLIIYRVYCIVRRAFSTWLEYFAFQRFRGQLAILNWTRTLADGSRWSGAATLDPVYVFTRWMYRARRILLYDSDVSVAAVNCDVSRMTV